MYTQSRLNRKLHIAFASVILILLGVGAISYRAIGVSDESYRWVQHTHKVLEDLQDLLSTMQSGESSFREFMIAGQEQSLQPYRDSVARSRRMEAIVRNITVDNPVQQLQVSTLEMLDIQKIQYAETVIGLRRTMGWQAVSDSVASVECQRLTDEYGAAIRDMQNEELRLLVIRDADSKRRLRQTKASLIFGSILSLAIAAVAGLHLRRDNSRREFNEQALRESEEKYRMLIYGVHDYGIVMLGPLGEFVSWSPGSERMTGCTFDDLAGHDFSYFFPQQEIQRGRPAEILRLAAANGRYEDQGVRVRKDGSRFQVRAIFTALRDSVGNLRGFSVISRDLTESAESEAKYRGLLDAAPDPMVVVNQAGEIVLVNVQAEKQFGYKRDELVGRKITTIIPQGFAERLIADSTRSTAEVLAQQIGMGIELNGRRKYGDDFPIEIMLSPRESAEGILITAAIRDITERKHLEQMLRQAQKMEAVGQLAGGVAHDFNNLLGVILGYSDLLLERLALNHSERADIQEIQKAGFRAALLTRQLLAFSRKQVLQPKVLDLNAVVAGAETLLRRLIGENIELLVVPDPEIDRVKADSGQLEQIIMNLAVNSRDAMPDGGKLTIETSNVELDERFAAQHPSMRPGPHVMLAVTDTGCGMDAKTKAHLFEPFFTTKEVGKGTGLGLSTVFGIVKQTGGTIWVYSEPGIGTTFKIYFPCVAPALEIESPVDNVKNVGKGSQTILIVEDDAPLLEVARRSLQEFGYTILKAHSPREAIQISESHRGPIHLMVTDVIMPGMNGNQLASRLSAPRPEMKVLYVSGYTDNAIVHHGVLEPGLAFLQKPFSPKTLARKAGELLTEPSLFEDLALCEN
jgi:two-component system, cell cycle sensor histidine kinase and response regulator CckA